MIVKSECGALKSLDTTGLVVDASMVEYRKVSASRGSEQRGEAES